MRQAGQVLQTYDDSVGLLVSSVLKTLALVATVWLLWLILARVVPLLQRQPDIVFDLFTNATGDAELDKALPGLTQLAREQLAESLDTIRSTALEYQALLGDAAAYVPRQPKPLPTEAIDTHLTDLLTSLKDAAPGEIKSVVPLVGLAFPQRGTRITGILQRQGDAPGVLGLTVRIADLQGRRPPALYTVWDNTPSIAGDVAQDQTDFPAAEPIAADANVDPRVQAYVENARRLHRLGLMDDALACVRFALQVDPADPETQDMLDRYTQALAHQQGRSAMEASAQRCENAGLVSQAVAMHVEALGGTSAERYASALWKVALKRPDQVTATELDSLRFLAVDQDDVPAALIKLADAYAAEAAHLPDVAVALLKQAASDGSMRAERKLQALQASVAADLVAVGDAFLRLAEYSSAQKYLQAALDRQPDNHRATRAMADLRQYLPAQADKDALALYTLGSTYEQAGAFASAKSYYEQAVLKQPTYADAQAGLLRVLAQPRSLAERYYPGLVWSATWSVAIDLTIEDMLAQARRVPPEQRPGFSAQVHAFAADLNNSAAASYGEPWLSRAVECAEHARDACAGWYSAHLTLADAYSERGNQRARSGAEPLAASADLRRALRAYQTARRLVEDAHDLRKGVPEAIVSDPLTRGSPEQRARQKITVLRRIRLGEAIAWQRLGDDDAVATSRAIIDSIENGVIDGVHWDSTDPDEIPQILINHGEWHGRQYANTLDEPERTAAIRFVAYALVRYERGADVDLAYNYVQASPELTALAHDMSVLVQHLPRFVLIHPDLVTAGGAAFRETINEFLQHAQLPV